MNHSPAPQGMVTAHTERAAGVGALVHSADPRAPLCWTSERDPPRSCRNEARLRSAFRYGAISVLTLGCPQDPTNSWVHDPIPSGSTICDRYPPVRDRRIAALSLEQVAVRPVRSPNGLQLRLRAPHGARMIPAAAGGRAEVMEGDATGPRSVANKEGTMSAKILQINYKLTGPRVEYESENLPYAQPIADIPGLRWKVWIINEAQSEAGGIYLFESDAAVQAFVDGPIIAE